MGRRFALVALGTFNAALLLVLWAQADRYGVRLVVELVVLAELVLAMCFFQARRQRGAETASLVPLAAPAADAGPLADLAHELRSPLTVLAGEIEAMQIGLRQPDAQTLDAMAGEVQRLSRLLQDLDRLLGHTRPADSVPIQIIDVGGLIEQLLQRHRLSLQRAGLTVTLTRKPAPSVAGDVLRLEQLFTNLLQNSLRYTDPPGQIVIRVEGTYDGAVEVTWEDSSPGVPGQDLPRLTERFYRVPGHGVRHPHASGLGLAIARAIAEAHSATLHARHSQLGGLCWVLRVEAAEEEMTHEASGIAG
ncbi:ATP-binding protein [Silvimonas iriomotensis]|uniref:histidine kinase n=1 Tax=Silvimonas iriomotensis TaxID=449662 RepID=A0ABQ2P4C2_9NEIS|nr:ATP-binding protein [Silvimonas iriomotensis]GGP17893.1 hypothetical protein GCM10010970_02080 [Silvimonas iriomotensis]